MTMLLRAVAGLILWGAGFCAIYALHGIACANGWEARAWGPVSLQRAVLLAAWAVALGAGAWLVWWERRGEGFAGRLALAGAVIGLLSTLVTGLPIVVFPGCL